MINIFNKISLLLLFLTLPVVSCRKDASKKEEALNIADLRQSGDLSVHLIGGNTASGQSTYSPNTVLLTGNDRFRLLTVYRVKPASDRNIQYHEGTSYNPYAKISEDDDFKYFMPGMDMISGYNLVNIGHYDVEKDTLTYFFRQPVLIRTLYFPGVKRDSLCRKPVSRNYYLVSVYDEDTNNDSLINRNDLRRMYHFDEANTHRTQLLPPAYSAIKSDYDYRNDAMYIYARFDENGNGIPEKDEPVSIFMLKLNDPTRVRKII